VIALDDSWIWDSWYVQHAGTWHAFYLKAPKSLGDPELRHLNARVGHSMSRDLVNWTTLPDALTPGPRGAFDDLAIWTGSIVRHAGIWHLFYTGVDERSRSRIQRIGHAVSTDLLSWHRVSTQPVSTADARWHSTEEWSPTGDEPWRDPWVFFSDEDAMWHMVVTATSLHGGDQPVGNLGHLVSPDLYTWRCLEPLIDDTQLRQLEVPELVEIDGRTVLVFCLSATDVYARGVRAFTGTYTAPMAGALGPVEIGLAEPVDVPGNYAGRVVMAALGEPVLMAFVNQTADGEFGGVIADPVPLALTARGTLQPVSST
jgi:beta-fructofuranosidase